MLPVLSKKHVMMLLTYVPEEATDLRLHQARIFFNMPDGWEPSEASGIFRNDAGFNGECKWQVRL